MPPKLTTLLFVACVASAQQHVTLPTQDGGTVYADVYGEGDRGVVLAHGGQFRKESWKDQANILGNAGFRSIAVEFRGFGESTGPGQADPMSAPLKWDLLAAVRYLRKTGCKTVSIVGASMGGWAAVAAALESIPGEIDRLVLLAAGTDAPVAQLNGRKLFIVARDDTSGSGDGPRLPKIKANFEQATEPKKLVILEGSAHAQFLFATDQGGRLMKEILEFLSAP